jgi:hypothetical protein
MSTSLFLLSLLIAVTGPVLAITYLRPILLKVLHSLCSAEGGAEFWLRSAYLLAVCGTLLLMLSFGQFDAQATVVDTLRRALWLVLLGVFATVGLISHQVWGQVRDLLDTRRSTELAQQGALAAATLMGARPATPATHQPGKHLKGQDDSAWPHEGDPA